MPVSKLLILSNGYGEDAVGAEIARRLPKTMEIAAYPTLGPGRAYEGVCPIVGPRRELPSEGHRLRGSLIRDALAGFGIGPALKFMRNEAKAYDAILVVGDMLGIVMCWWTGSRVRIYLDVYKSGYAHTYSALERFLLRRSVDLVLNRDPILAAQLQTAHINARFAGSAMMDTVRPSNYSANDRRRHAKAIAVLPGSRSSMATNFTTQLAALRQLPGIEGMDVFAVLARPGDAVDLADASGLNLTPPKANGGDLGILSDGRVTIYVSTGTLAPVVGAVHVVLGQAGTANQQAYGLGRPVVGFHAEGETPKRQSQDEAMAGDAAIFTPRDPAAMAAAIARLLADEPDRLRRGAIGAEHMGPPGAIPAIIEELTK
ncbi:MAG: hypothetical protein ABIQ30_00975 [Devosia sp.]